MRTRGWFHLLAAAVASLTIAVASPAGAEPVKRSVPNYDGRVEADTTPGDVLLWVPRILFSPAYLVSEFVLRRPLGWLITETERLGIPGILADFFTLDEAGKVGIVPTFLLDFGTEAGVLPSVGFYFFWDEFLAQPNELRLRAAFGGSSDWVVLDVTDRINLGDSSRLLFSFDWSRRKDWVFAGIGEGFDGDEAIGRYGQDRVKGSLGYDMTLGPRGVFEAELALSDVSFFSGGCCGDRRIGERIIEGVYPKPFGLGEGYSFVGPSLHLALDSRDVRPGDETGARLDLYGSLALGLDDDKTGDGWVQAGARVGGFVDLWNNRTIGVQAYVAFTESLDDAEVPFGELTQLGGDHPLRAFVEGQLRGETALAFTIDYRYPIWVWLDGVVFFTAGNVFTKDIGELSDIDFEDFRLSFGMGMRPGSVEDHPFELLFAIGTETIRQGADITTFRFVAGTNSGF